VPSAKDVGEMTVEQVKQEIVIRIVFMRRFMSYPNSWYIISCTLEEFILGMLRLGHPLEMSLVGDFDKTGRGSRRDIDLPLHQDGKYSEELTKAQGGFYIEKTDIDVVGLYCIKDDPSVKCITIVDDAEVELKKGQALIFNNRNVFHGRKGHVGNRLLLRFWIKNYE
jgi:hypothetical protein